MKLLKNKSIIVMFLSKINDHICDVDNTYVARYIVWKNSKKNIDLVNDFCCFCDARSKKKTMTKKIYVWSLKYFWLHQLSIYFYYVLRYLFEFITNMSGRSFSLNKSFISIFFCRVFAKFDRASAILQCHMWHGVL